MSIHKPHSSAKKVVKIQISRPRIITLCSFCSKTKGIDNNWRTINHGEKITQSSEISHGFCPDCRKKHFSFLNSD